MSEGEVTNDNAQREWRGINEAVKMEASIVSPREDKEIVDIVTRGITFFYQKFGDYIPEEKRRKPEDWASNMIATSTDLISPLAVEWEQSVLMRKIFRPLLAMKSYLEAMAWGVRLKDNQHGLSVFNKDHFDRDFGEVWKSEDADVRKAYESLYGVDAEEVYIRNWRLKALIHETIHGFQEVRLPTRLIEISVRYYTSVIIEEGFGLNIRDHWDKEVRIFYDELLEKYGVDLHRIVFGARLPYPKRVSDETKKIVLREFKSDRAKKIYPGFP